MKSPWHFGILALAVTGVSIYDFTFFKNKQSEKPISIQMKTDPSKAAIAEPLLSPLPEPANADKATGLIGADPFISQEELRKLSQQAFISKNPGKANAKASWPERDPFAADKAFIRSPYDIPAAHLRNPFTEDTISEQKPHDITVKPLMKETPSPLPGQSAPQYVFSGTLIEGENKLALVNGSPLSIGDRLGIWQLARIEPGYIILEVGQESYRIELKGAEPQTAH